MRQCRMRCYCLSAKNSAAGILIAELSLAQQKGTNRNARPRLDGLRDRTAGHVPGSTCVNRFRYHTMAMRDERPAVHSKMGFLASGLARRTLDLTLS